MNIKVKFINGNDVIINFDGDKILNLKEKIAENENISIDAIKLIFAGKILKNEETIEMHKINESSTIHCVVRRNNPNNIQQSLNNNSQNNTIPDMSSNTIPLPNFIPDMSSNTIPLPNLFPNQQTDDLSENNILNSNINNILTMYQIPQFRELIISSTLNRMNLPIDSPFRHVIETNMNMLLQNPQMATSVINNMNNLNNANDNLSQFMNMFNNMNINSEEPVNTDQTIIPSQVTDSTQNTNNLDDLRQKYSNELEEVKLMGFEDEELILNTLNQSHGSVVITVNKLLG